MNILRQIAEARGTCITIVESSGQPAKVEEALREVESALSKEQRAELVKPLREKWKQFEGEQKGSVVLLRSADLNEIRMTGEEMPSMHSVADQFALRPLLPAFQEAHEFYILALSRNRTRLLHCTASEAEEVPLPKDTPTSLSESKSVELESSLDMGAVGPSQGQMKGVMSGVSADVDKQPEYSHNFFVSVDRAVNAVAKNSSLPLVLVGVESELAIYRDVNSYPLLAPTGVLGSPDSFKGGEMHARGLRALSTFVAPAVDRMLGELDKLIGTGHASVHAADIVKAAHEGRVEHLFLQSSAEYLGTFDESRGKTSHHGSNGDGERHDLMDDATRQTILHGGQVTVLTGRQMPNGVPVCAVFRY